MADFIFRISPNIVLGSYTSSRLGQFAKEWGTHYMIIMDPYLKNVGLSQKIQQSLTDRNINFFVFDEIADGSSTKNVQQALDLARNAHIHGVIAIGGSKAINVGRAISSIYNDANDLYAFVDGAVPTVAPLPLICVPTTIRDKFIFADTIPLIDSRGPCVKLLKTRGDLCKLVLFDPNLTSTLAENQTVAMSIETLCMAAESYLSPKANFFSDMLVEKAAELFNYALDGTSSLNITTPQEILLSQAGCMASLATGISSLGAASLLALSINMRYKISRSLITSMFFPYIIEDGKAFKSARLAKFARIMGITDESGESKDDVIVSDFAENIRQRLAKANLPTRLKDLSLTIEQLSLAAEDAGQLSIVNMLPRSMTADDLFDLIKKVY